MFCFLNILSEIYVHAHTYAHVTYMYSYAEFQNLELFEVSNEKSVCVSLVFKQNYILSFSLLSLLPYFEYKHIRFREVAKPNVWKEHKIQGARSPWRLTCVRCCQMCLGVSNSLADTHEWTYALCIRMLGRCHPDSSVLTNGAIPVQETQCNIYVTHEFRWSRTADTPANKDAIF